jgi:UDP-glucose:glycoprotein glucosyltransferase
MFTEWTKTWTRSKIPEWEQYDSEIAHFTRRLAEEGRIHASAAAADVNELAKAGSVGPVRTPSQIEDTLTSEAESPEAIRDELWSLSRPDSEYIRCAIFQ